MNTNIDKYDMEGPFPLDSQSINNEVEKAIGVYILGKNNDVKSFKPKYVGRSDDDLNGRLHDHINKDIEYTHFMYLYIDSVKNAFDYECKLYHLYAGDIGQLKNERHPKRPDNLLYLFCPVCDIFG